MSRKRSIVSATFLAVIAFVSGLLVGSHRVSQTISEKGEGTQSLTENKTNRPPQVRHRKTSGRSEEPGPPKIRSLDEVKAALAEIGIRKLADRFTGISELVASVEPTDLPAVLELAEKTSPNAFRVKLREGLLERWAETEPE